MSQRHDVLRHARTPTHWVADAANPHKLKQLSLIFPSFDAPRPEMSGMHFGTLLRLEDEAARKWYINETY